MTVILQNSWLAGLRKKREAARPRAHRPPPARADRPDAFRPQPVPVPSAPPPPAGPKIKSLPVDLRRLGATERQARAEQADRLESALLRALSGLAVPARRDGGAQLEGQIAGLLEALPHPRLQSVALGVVADLVERSENTQLVGEVEAFCADFGARGNLFGALETLAGWTLLFGGDLAAAQRARELFFDLFPHGPLDDDQRNAATDELSWQLRQLAVAPGEAATALRRWWAARRRQSRAAASQSIGLVDQWLEAQPQLQVAPGARMLVDSLRRMLEQHADAACALDQAFSGLARTLARGHARPTDLECAGLAALVQTFSQSDVPLEGMALFEQLAEALRAPNVKALLAEVARASELHQVAELLVRAGLRGDDQEWLPRLSAGAAEALGHLSPEGALRVAIAFSTCALESWGLAPHTGEAALRGAIELFAGRSERLPVELLGAEAGAICAMVDGQIAYRVPPEEAVTNAFRIRAAVGIESLGSDGGEHWGNLLGALRARFPRLSLDDLLEADAAGRPGLRQLPATFGQELDKGVELLKQLVAGIDATRVGTEAEQARLYRQLLLAASRTVAAEKVPKARKALLLTGIQGATRPRARFAMADLEGVDRQTVDLRTFLDAHPSLPPDAALLAGQVLSSRAISFFEERCANAGSVESLLDLRDAFFACARADRVDLFEAMARAPHPPKGASRTVEYLADHFRRNRVKELRVDELIRLLRRPGDPIATLEAQAADKAISRIGIDQIPVHLRDAAGLEAIEKARVHVAQLIETYQRRHLADGVDREACQRLLLDALRGVVRGQWPELRYRGANADKLLGALSAAQKDAWRAETVSALADPRTLAQERSRLVEADRLAAGLLLALQVEVSLQGAEPDGLRFDEPSLARALARRDELLAAAREAPKGSPRHREVGRALRKTQWAVSTLSLWKALGEAYAVEMSPAQRLQQLRPSLTAAVGSLGQLGATGSKAAVRELLGSAQAASAGTSEGSYAVDEDGLEPMLASHLVGCMRADGGSRAWGLLGGLLDPNTKMVRIYREGGFAYRGYLRVWPVETDGYAGPALWVEIPKPDGGGNEADLRLLLRHAIVKARQMGVPVMSNDVHRPIGTMLAQEARAMGLVVEEHVPTTFSIREGTLPSYHSDNLLNDGFVPVRVADHVEPDGVWRLRKPATVIFP